MSLNTGTLDKKKNQVFVPYSGKIADITHADINDHTLNLKTAIPTENRTIVAIQLRCDRISGTGAFRLYSGSGTATSGLFSNTVTPVIILGTKDVLNYALQVANDDFDLYCGGYVVEI